MRFQAATGMSRRLFVVRHAEREDNVNHNWQSKYPGFLWDNTPLSDRGRSQAEDLCKYFENVKIDSIYVSPFDRTMETATTLLGKQDIKINVEPGMCEALYLCCTPPGFWATNKLAEKFDRVDSSYKPVCPMPLPKEKSGDRACCDRVSKAVHGILKRDSSETIVLVGHGASIAAVHSAFGHSFTHVGQATITMFEEDQRTNKFHLVKSGDSNHLSPDNRHNLRAY